MKYTQLTPTQVQSMLKVIGVVTIRDLFSGVRDEHMLDKPLAVPPGISELELLADCQALAGRNRDLTQSVCFLGGGSYDHFVPTLVDHLAMQGEFLTAYTPYQAEASQGVLQAFFEFQTMICRLTGMDVSNASLYEFATAAAEAVTMSLSVTGRNRVLVADNVHPDTRAVIDTYARQRGVEVAVVASKGGVVDEAALAAALDDDVAAVLVQSPNFFGCVERLDRIVPAIRASGALALVSFDPLAGGVLKPPGAFGADIVVGEGQALGIPPQYGGPYLGLLACREEYLRKIPGRVVGVTHDKNGRRGFCLTLQTREQHIRREKATSNVCTNQGLLAMRASVYMAAMGRRGIEKVASMCLDKSHYAAERISAIKGYRLRFAAPFFKEFVVQTDRDVPALLARCRKLGILAGVPLGRFDEQYADCFLVAVTEKRTKTDIDRLCDALGERQ
ncbi:MAG: aminomethyl-transferring glycine dehydrogenase subunit GcvPA [Phycisphaerales bacterium]|nr:MAG: aminomethyl-transferring glycine dehydrogenase subunit GcvPA [Phycisphaerales bacterium]